MLQSSRRQTSQLLVIIVVVRLFSSTFTVRLSARKSMSHRRPRASMLSLRSLSSHTVIITAIRLSNKTTTTTTFSSATQIPDLTLTYTAKLLRYSEKNLPCRILAVWNSLPANTDFLSLAAFRRTVYLTDLTKFLHCNAD